MGTLRKRIVTLGESAAPRGRVRRMQLRMSVDVLATLALATLALALSAAYQVIVAWRPGRRSSGP